MELHDKLEIKFRLDEKQKKALHKLNLFSIYDLLFYFPVRYSDISEVKQIAELIPGETATVCGKISKLKTKKSFRSKIPMGEGEIEDLSGKIKIIWFHQAYLAKMIHEGETVKLTGKVTQGTNGIYLANRIRKNAIYANRLARYFVQKGERKKFRFLLSHLSRN